MIENFILISIIFVTNFFFKKINFLLNSTGQQHQFYNQNSKVPLTGGFFILLFILVNYLHFSNLLIIFLIIFFSLGLMADINFIKSASYRFFIQLLLIVLFIISLKISISDIRIEFINILLNNNSFNIFFVAFCFLVLINGTNFIDGNNGNTLGYYIIVLSSLLFLSLSNVAIYENIILTKFIIFLIILYLFNIFNRFYLGDNGVYILSILVGYLIIDFINKNINISPYFIVNVLWYPAFEILFSLVRKIKSKYSPLMPDTLHFHQLLFYFLSKKTRINKVFINSLTGLCLNLINGVFVFTASMFIFNTKAQILLLSLMIIFYVIFYRLFFKFKFSK
tara:strand:+ start:2312 stop:3322 length:1011 start_codon:yes stop_codon:yes gene_type:complete